MEDLVLEAWQKTKLQKCVVHKMRNVLNDICPKEKKEVAEDLKHVFDNFDAESTKEKVYEKVDSLSSKNLNTKIGRDFLSINSPLSTVYRDTNLYGAK